MPFPVCLYHGTGVALSEADGVLKHRDSNFPRCLGIRVKLGKRKKGQTMNVFKKLVDEEHGQGLAEYTLIVFLVALVFWVAMKETSVGTALSSNWSKIVDCVSTPFSCSSAS